MTPRGNAPRAHHSLAHGALWSTFGLALVLIGPLRGHEGLHVEIGRVTKQIEDSPQDPKLFLKRARLRREHGLHELALKDLDQVARLAPTLGELQLEQGLTLRALGQLERAEERLDSFLLIVSRPSQRLKALVARAQTRSDREMPLRAIEDYTSAIALEPQASLYLERGALQERLEAWDDAAQGYLEGLSSLGDVELLIRALVSVETQRGNYKEALQRVDARLARYSVKAPWLLRRADVLEAAGDTDGARSTRLKALAESDSVLRVKPTATHRLTRVRALLALGEHHSAREELATLLAIAPAFPPARTLAQELGADAPFDPITIESLLPFPAP